MKLKITKLLLILCLVFSGSAMASQFKSRVGAGLQYGGLIGWQGSYNPGNNSIRFALGYAGFAYGYDRYIGDSYSLGLQAFGNQSVIGFGLNANYFPNTRHNPGWVFGVDVFTGYDTLEFTGEFLFDFFFNPGNIDIDAELEPGVLVSIGYQF